MTITTQETQLVFKGETFTGAMADKIIQSVLLAGGILNGTALISTDKFCCEVGTVSYNTVNTILNQNPVTCLI